MDWHGDIKLGDTLHLKFTTVGTSGAPTQLAGSPVISAYPTNNTTQITAGITLTVDFDSVTGLNHVQVVASTGNGYLTATDYTLVITTGTVGGTSVVGYEVGSFSIGNRIRTVVDGIWNEPLSGHIGLGIDAVAEYLKLVDTYGQFLSTATGSHGEGLTLIPAGTLTAAGIDAILDDPIGDGTLTVRQALRVIVAMAAGKLSGAATTTTTIRNLADTANVIVATVDTDGNRSAVTVVP